MRTPARAGLGALAAASTTILTLFLAAPRAAAQDLLAYEGFDYGATGSATQIAGFDGGAGWMSPWTGTVAGNSGLLVFYPFDFSAWDAGQFGANGIEKQGAGYSIESPPGMFWSGGSLELKKGPKQYIDLDAHVALFQPLARGTVSVWIKNSSTGTQTIFAASDRNTSPLTDFGLRLANGKASFGVRGEFFENGTVNSTNRVDDGNWHHIAVTVTGTGNVKLYIDGLLDKETNLGFFSNILEIDHISFGRNVINSAAPTQFYDGLIDEFAIWGSVLTDAEIAMLAGVDTLPALIPGPMTPPGPNLESDSLGGSALPHAAFAAAGFTAYGNRFDDASGERTGRMMTTGLNLKTDADYYVSALIRREDQGPITPAEIQFADKKDVRARFGWDANGDFVAGMEQPHAGSPTQKMNAGQTYLAVFKISAKASSSDAVFLKVFRAGDTIPPDDTGFSAQGAGANRWTVEPPVFGSGATLDQIWLKQEATGSRMIVDEIRVGASWASVTRFSYGSGCLGTTIGATGRPALGSSTYTIDLANAQANVAGFLLIGALPTTLDLTSIGGTGCTLLSSAEIALPTVTDASGAANVSLGTIPNDPLLAGLPLYVQFGSQDTTNQLPLAFSDGLQVLIEK